jgi:hypothetical protein
LIEDGWWHLIVVIAVLVLGFLYVLPRGCHLLRPSPTPPHPATRDKNIKKKILPSYPMHAEIIRQGEEKGLRVGVWVCEWVWDGCRSAAALL